MNSKSLYGLSMEWTALEGLIETAYEQTTPQEGAAPEEIEELELARKAIDAALLEQLMDHNAAVADKIDAYCSAIKSAEKRQKAREEEARRIATLAVTDASLVKRLKANLQRYMEITGNDKIAGTRFAVALQMNGGKAPLVLAPGVEDDLDKLDPRWIRIKKELDTDAIRTALEANDKTALKVACLAPRGKHVRIK